MAEPKKKTTTAKKASSTTKKTTSKKSPAKKTSTAAKKTVTKKTTTIPVASAPAVKSVSKKTAPKKSPAKKKLPAKTAPVKLSEKAIPTTFIKEALPKTISSKKSVADMSMFATMLAVFVVGLVVLAGYIYSRQARMMNEAPSLTPVVSEPQQIKISSSVILTPEIMSALEDLVAQIAIAPDEVLLDVSVINDVDSVKTESPDFFLNAQSGDMVFGFQSTDVLFRPSTKEIITTGPSSKRL